jgi:flagellar biosynthesis/type III secretory pathway protein FliH
MLRQAVRNGYEQGFRAGQSDREDRWRSNYQDSYGYQDASYGYGSYYVGLGDYQYYFREGFRRGYEDGYYGRYRYGSNSNGAFNILSGVLQTILNLQDLR